MFDPKKLNIRSRIIYTYGIIFHIHVKNQQTPDNFKDTYESKQISALKVSQIKNLPLPTRQMLAALSLKKKVKTKTSIVRHFFPRQKLSDFCLDWPRYDSAKICQQNNNDINEYVL